MSMLDGISQCWWLSDTCGVNWNAWAAIGSFFAAGIAVYIGLAPILLRKRQAKAIARIAVVKLEQNLMNIIASRAVAHQEALTNEDVNVLRINLENIDARALRDLVAYFDVLPGSIRNYVAGCIADTETCMTLMRKTAHRTRRMRPPTELLVSVWTKLTRDVEASTKRTWLALAEYTEAPVVDIDSAGNHIGLGLTQLARSIERAGELSEQELRERIIGRSN